LNFSPLEDEDTAIPRHVGNHSPNESVKTQKTRIFSYTAVRTENIVLKFVCNLYEVLLQRTPLFRWF